MGKSNGNTLIEYGLIGSLILVVAIFVIMGLGNDLASWLSALKGELQSNVASANAPAPGAPGTAAINPPAAASSLPVTALTNMGDMYSFEVLPGQFIGISKRVETAGAMGTSNTTDSYAATLIQIADALKAEHPELANSIYELGLRGKALAQSEKNLVDSYNFAMHDYLQSRPELKAALEQTKQNQPPGDYFYWEEATENDNSGDPVPRMQTQRVSLQSFQEQWDRVNHEYDLGVLPPDTRAMVNYLAGEITTLGNQFGVVKQDTEVAPGYKLWQMHYSSDITYMNSEKIQGCADHQC